jgi:hypothetical protein
MAGGEVGTKAGESVPRRGRNNGSTTGENDLTVTT